MKKWGHCVGVLALVVFLLPSATAQEKKGKGKEAEKKAKVKDDAKDVEKKGTEKTEPAKKEEKLVYGQMVSGVKLTRLDGSTGGFAIDVPEIDPMKVYQFNIWKAQQLQSIATSSSFQQRAQRTASFQQQMALKQARGEMYSMKAHDMKFGEGCKIRTLFPPIQYDDEGKLKRWTQRDLKKLRGKTSLPGYPAEMDAIKIGQTVDVYLAKKVAGLGGKGSPPRKKKKGPDDDPPVITERPEVVMIVIRAEPPMR